MRPLYQVSDEQRKAGFGRWPRSRLLRGLSFSSTDTNLPRPCDAFHPDQEASSPHAHPARADGSAGRGASREPLPGTAAGSAQVLAGLVGSHRQKRS